MSNTVKTAFLLGALSAALMFIGEALGGAQGLILGFLFAVGDQLRVVLVLGQDRPADVQRAGGRTRPPALRHRRAAGAARRPAAAALSTSSPTRRRTRLRRAATRSTPRSPRPKGILQIAERRRAGRRDRPRARARQAPRHPDQLGRRDAGRGHHDGLALRDVLRRRPRRRSRGRQPDRAASRR